MQFRRTNYIWVHSIRIFCVSLLRSLSCLKMHLKVTSMPVIPCYLGLRNHLEHAKRTSRYRHGIITAVDCSLEKRFGSIVVEPLLHFHFPWPSIQTEVVQWGSVPTGQRHLCSATTVSRYNDCLMIMSIQWNIPKLLVSRADPHHLGTLKLTVNMMAESLLPLTCLKIHIPCCTPTKWVPHCRFSTGRQLYLQLWKQYLALYLRQMKSTWCRSRGLFIDLLQDDRCSSHSPLTRGIWVCCILTIHDFVLSPVGQLWPVLVG